jgi:chromosomal replication initiator protein
VLENSYPGGVDKLKVLWDELLDGMKELLNEQCFQTWISPMRPVSYEAGVLRIEGPNPFFVDWVCEHHIDKIERVARDMLEKDTRVELTSRPGPSRVSPPEKSTARTMIVREPVALPNKIHLNGRYTFDEFIVGNCNRLAHSGALAVAERPAQAYNPLFIYGGSGLGKTHLIQAIGHRVRKEFPGMIIAYVSTESFVNELIHAIQKNKTLEFKKKYRNVDILLIDDIQFLAGKEAMQEEFFHTFNALHDANKQIVCTSDRPPKEIHTLEERLRTRFEWGLITDLQSPDLETRIAILRNKIEDENIQIPDNVIEFIASNITNNIRLYRSGVIK